MAKYKLDGLKSKYGGFAAPDLKLSLGGKPIKDEHWQVSCAEAELTAEILSGVCSITLTGLYDARESKFVCEEDFVLGAPVTVEFGYTVTSPVFYGYLYSVEYAVGVESESRVTLTCMDIKAAMMGAGMVGFSGTTTYKQVIEGFFSGENARGYTELCKAPDMSALSELERPISMPLSRMDDYAFLSETARLFGLECFVDEGKLIMRREPESKTPLLELSGLDYIYEVTALKTTLGYIGQMTVYGGTDDERDSEKKRARAQVKNSVEISPKNSGGGRLIGKREMQLFSPSVKDEKAAKELAQAQLRRRQRLMSEISVTVQGIPELKPGYYLKLDKISPGIDGDLYITSANHILDDEGYRTKITARRE